MINDYSNGGLGMLDIQSFNYALKAKWVQKYMDPNNKGKWKLFLDFFLGKHDHKLLFTGNLKLDDVTVLQIKDAFHKEVAECWSRLNFKTQLSNFPQSVIIQLYALNQALTQNNTS